MSDTPRTDAAYFSNATLYDLAGEMKKLERELTAANARIKTLEEQIESHSFALSPAMVQARNDQLNAENHRLLERIRGLEIQTLWDSAELRKQDAEIERLRAGGCARDQRTTQFCGEALALQEENAKLQERIARLEEASAWRPIETAPTDMTWVIGYDDKDGEVGTIIFDLNGDMDGEETHYEWTDGIRTWHPTHWMLIPDPPKAKDTQ